MRIVLLRDVQGVVQERDRTACAAEAAAAGLSEWCVSQVCACSIRHHQPHTHLNNSLPRLMVMGDVLLLLLWSSSMLGGCAAVVARQTKSMRQTAAMMQLQLPWLRWGML